MSKLLYIDDQLINLPPTVVIAQTLQIFDPGRIGSIVTNFTSSIRLKDTFLNEQVVGFLSDSKTKSDVPYSSLSCKYIENGIPLIRNGRVVINEANDGYSLTIYSGPWGFFEIVESWTLWDLNFLDINTSWSQADRDGYRNTTTGIVQALVDDGRLVQDQAASAPTIENQGDILKPPQVYYHTVIEKIFESAGFEYEGDIFTNDVFLKLAMPLSVVYFDPAFLESKSFFAAAPGTQEIVNPVSPVDVLFNQNVKQGSDSFYDGISQYIVNNPDTTARYYRLQFFFDLTIEVIGGTVDINITPGAGYSDTIEETNVGSGTYSASYLSSLGQAHGDIIKVTITTNTGTPTVNVVAGSFYTVTYTGTDGEQFVTNIVPAYVYFNKLFPRVAVLDLLRDFCVRFQVQITQINNKIVCNTFNHILDLRSGPDWTTKRDKGLNRIRYLFSSYGRVNVIKSPTDDFTPDLTDNYGDGSFEIPNENLRASSVVYTSMFNVTQMINTFGVLMLNMNLEPDISQFGRMPGLRLFFVRDRYDHEPPVLYDAIDREDYKVGYFFDPNQTYELSWQFFIDNFHTKYIERSLRKVRLIEREYNLNDLDIYAFNQQVPIWDSNERFLVTKIINRVSGKACKVELLKIDPNPAVFFVEQRLDIAITDFLELTGAVSQLTDQLEIVDLDITNVAPIVFLDMELFENVTGNPTWQCVFDNLTTTQILSVVGNLSGDVNQIPINSTIETDVTKTNNDGNGIDGFTTNFGWVEWLRNGVQEHTETFSNGENSTYSYTYTGLVVGDTIKVIVHEDGTTP